jgi:uncharacterized membrane protein (DUF4010 family)
MLRIDADQPDRYPCALVKTMDLLQLFERLGVALAIGLLIGIERGWHERSAKPGSRSAGVRTFALIGLLGGVLGALSGSGNAVLAGVMTGAFSVGFAVFEWTENRANGIYSATRFVAGLLTFALGALSVTGYMAAASAVAVAAALLLAERQALHAFVERLQWPELRSALILLVMTVVMLPLLPNRTVDPWQSLNPYELWAVTAAIAALSYAGYAAVRLLGERRGLLVGALAAAVVSSTAVTMNYAVLPQGDRRMRSAISSGIAGAWAISLLRVGIIAVFVAPGLAGDIVPPVAAGAATLFAACAYWFLQSNGADNAPENALGEPFNLSLVLRFGLLLAVVVLVYKIVVQQFGSMGLVPLAAISGTADVDPITFAVSKSAGTSIPLQQAAMLILLASSTNFGVRAAVLLWTRKPAFFLPLIGTGVAALTLAWTMVIVRF